MYSCVSGCYARFYGAKLKLIRAGARNLKNLLLASAYLHDRRMSESTTVGLFLKEVVCIFYRTFRLIHKFDVSYTYEIKRNESQNDGQQCNNSSMENRELVI